MLCAPIKRGLLLEEDEKKHPCMDTEEDGMPARVVKLKNGVSFTITVTDVFVVPFVQLCKGTLSGQLFAHVCWSHGFVQCLTFA